MSSVYGLSTQFILRMTGFPVEDLLSLNRPALLPAADELQLAKESLEVARTALLDDLRQRGPSARKARKLVERNRPLEGVDDVGAAELVERYHRSRTALEATTARFAAQHAAEHEEARRALYARAADPRFRTVLLFSTPGLEALVPSAGAPLPQRNTDWRQREVTWLSYLQRLTTKNETISFYGPSVWGRNDARLAAVADLRLLDSEIAERVLYYERWVVQGLLDQLRLDEEALPHQRPRWAGDVHLEGDVVQHLGRGETLAVERADLALLRRCDGTQTVAALADEAAVRRLAGVGAIELVPSWPFSCKPFEDLAELIGSWPPSPVRERWTARLGELDELRLEVERAAGDIPRLRAALTRTLDATAALTGARRDPKLLYAARLPLNEDCKRAVATATLGAPFIERATQDLAPWYELWRDLAGLYATRIYETMRPILAGLGPRPVPLPAFFRACAAARSPFPISGGPGVVRTLYDEIQRAWQEQLGERGEAAQLTLTEDDLAFVRRRFRFRRMRGFDRPAPDLQIAARDEAALRAGDYTLLLAEIHGDDLLWQHLFYLWCPDPGRLDEEFARLPLAAFAPFGGAKLTPVHVALHVHARTPGTTVVADWPDGVNSCIRPADVWVHLTDDDIVARRADGSLLGSLIDTRSAAHATHQLQLLGTGAHVPRLLVGRVVVQRERWRVGVDDAVRGTLSAAAPADAYAMVRRLQREWGMPTQVFVQPELPMRSTLHKAGKPFFVDFRNPLLVEMAATQLRDYRHLIVTEALPSTDDCWLRDSRGHYSSELRMIAQPASARQALLDAGYVIAGAHE